MKKKSKIILTIFLIWFFGKLMGGLFLIPHPWGLEISGDLPDGGRVYFQSRQVGNETDNRLVWIDKMGQRNEFWVNRNHAGPEYVVMKVKSDKTGVWIESDEKVGASLDLTTGEFRSEDDIQFEWAKYGLGTTLAKGWTRGILNLLLPY
ncbi:MAG: hypothetical protein JXD22_10640 [Sedimentisphaerales bacterium]|nr:hypothetical protein [Sedimentisphaerales bacterium]